MSKDFQVLSLFLFKLNDVQFLLTIKTKKKEDERWIANKKKYYAALLKIEKNKKILFLLWGFYQNYRKLRFFSLKIFN